MGLPIVAVAGSAESVAHPSNMLAPQAKSVDRRNRDDSMTFPPVNSRSSDAGFPSVLPETNNIGPERFVRQPVRPFCIGR
jgi:hypothetical protein